MEAHARKEAGELSRFLEPSAARSSRRHSRKRSPSLLIADDTKGARELYAEYFGARGFTVVTANDGATAVQAAVDHKPDVIVMDLAMPQFDGITAIRRIKADARSRPSRVILLTGYPQAAVERGALEAGAELFLTKPCLPEVLHRHVNRVRRRPRPSVWIGQARLTPLAERIARTVYQNSPRLYCFTCLAAQLGLSEHDLRAAALMLVARAGLRLIRRACSACRRTDEALAAQKVG